MRYIRPPYAKKFYAACCIHDDDYDRGGTSENRLCADRTLFYNIQHTGTKDEYSPWRITWFTLIALLYYVSVRVFGQFYFNLKK